MDSMDLPSHDSGDSPGQDEPLCEGYEYQPLDRLRSEVRLLTVQPPATDLPAPIECNIWHASLSDYPDYETVSYVWGDPSRTRCIFVDQKVLWVPLSTWEVLLRFRYLYGPRTLWIDAVCINQEDLEEKSWQVPLMGAVYERCYSCLIYLGNGSDIMLQTLQSLVELCKDFRKVKEGLFRPPHAVKIVVGSSHGEVNVRNLIDLLALPWFQRVWVTQEAVLAEKSTCYYGQCEIDLDLLACIFFYLWDENAQLERALRSLPGSSAIEDLYQARRVLRTNSVRPSMSSVLRCRRMLQCTDNRDRVYGVLGITHNMHDIPPLLAVDYSKPYAAVIRDAVRNCIVEDGSLWVLGNLDHQPGEMCSESFPSWVPRFDREELLCSFLPRLYPLKTRRHHPRLLQNLPSDAHVPFPAKEETAEQHRDKSSPNVLQITGKKVDGIRRTHYPPFARSQKIEMLRGIMEFGEYLGIARTGRLPRVPIAGYTTESKPFPLDEKRDYLGELLGHLQNVGPIPNISRIGADADEHFRTLVKYSHALNSYLTRRALFSSEGGLLGLGPWGIDEGDQIVVAIKPDKWLLVVRPLKGGSYHMLGQCYVDELRSPELADAAIEGKEEQVFNIV